MFYRSNFGPDSAVPEASVQGRGKPTENTWFERIRKVDVSTFIHDLD